MANVFAAFWNLCIFRGSPADVPGDNNALAILLGLVIGLIFLQTLFVSADSKVTYMLSSVMMSGTVLTGILVSLRIKGLANRFRKTLAAYLGTLAIVEALALLIQVFSTNADGLQFVGAVIGLWRLAVIGFIVKQSMDISLLAGILLAFAFLVLGSLLMVSFFPGYIPTPA